MAKHNYYTVYDNNTDEIIACGNAVQCAEKIHIKVESFYYAISRQKRSKNKHQRYTIVVEKI